MTTALTQPSADRFPHARRWNAHWIWHPHAASRNAWVLFRAEFELDKADDVRLFISADTRYRLWVNDALLGDGPPQSQPYHQFYDKRDISTHIRPGTNCVAVLVQHQGVQDFTRGGLLVEIVDSAGRTRCATGGDWRTMIGPWRTNTFFSGGNKIGPFQEHANLSEMPVGWRAAGFDDGHWQEPAVISSRGDDRPPLVWPWYRMVPRNIQFLREQAVYAKSLQCVEECLDLNTRRDTGDVSLSLSQAGRPVDWATLKDQADLLSDAGETLLACSDRHRDGVTDGRYDPCITLDFGRVLTGYAEIDVEAPAGAVVEIGYAERLIDGRFNISLECPFGDRAILAEGANVFRPLIWRSFRYLRLRVKQCETPMRVRAMRAVEVSYPYENRGGFKGDERLEKVFAISRTTLELCSIESLMDTPYREQAQWLGDVSAVTVPAIYACFGDTDLPGKFLRQAAANNQPTGLNANLSNIPCRDWGHDIPDYSLWWVMGLWRHYQYTGDARYLHECYPEMQRIMRTHLQRMRDDGLLDPMFGWVFIDWAHMDLKGLHAHYNAIFTGACDAAAAIARFKHDAWAQQAYSDAARSIRKAFASTFIDPATGVVADCVDEQRRFGRCSEHANAAAIAFACVDDAAADRIIEKVFDHPSVKSTEAQPFFMVVVLEALRKRGRVDLALRLIDERWGKRMVDRGRTSCTEEWYENGSWRSGDWAGFQRTHSHAWSACPAEFLITGLAGIEIVGPGCRQLRIRPTQTPFAYDVVYPTPRGDVKIHWDGKQSRIQLPEGIEQVR